MSKYREEKMPFAKTALLSAANGSIGENIDHFTAVRMRVVGSGNLDMVLYSHDDILNQELVPFTMAGATNIQPTRLANFIQQRAMLNISVDEINEWFRINRIIVYTKEFATSFPG